MKVILLKNVDKLGKRYDIKEVNNGYALNLLLPQGLAIVASPDAVKRITDEKSKIDGQKKVHEDLLMRNLASLDGATVTIHSKANEKGHLFAGLKAEDIIKDVVAQTRVQMDASYIVLDHPIKETGEHILEVKAGGKSAKLKIVVGRKE